MEITIQAASRAGKSELDAILTGAAFHPITDRAFIRITGSDATRWLNGMVTNSIESLGAGEGNYNFLLSAQGRIQGDCTIYREPDGTTPAFMLETDLSQVEAIREHLDRFIIMDDVELQPVASNLSGVLLVGPKAPSVLESYYRSFRGGDHAGLPPLRLAFDSESGDWIVTPPPGVVSRFEIWNPADAVAALMQYGALVVSAEAIEWLRILEGTPRYGVDIRDRELPQETGQTRALHFSKGCYLGQEIVERIRSRGNVHRTFGGFELTGRLPEAGVALEAEGKAVGELTSVAAIPLPGRAEPVQLALGYVRREALDRGLTLEYAGGTAKPVGLPYALV